MKAAVVTFPGSNCDRDLAVAFERAGAEVVRVWHKETALPAGVDIVGIPGGFSFGDYLRCGAIAARSPIGQAVAQHAARGGFVLGICNGFQVLTEMGLLPGALMRNAGLKFICKPVTLRVATADSAFTGGWARGDAISLPVAHHDGNYTADAETLGKTAGKDAAADWIVVVVSYSLELLRQLRQDALGDASLAGHGASPGAMRGLYRLACSLSA